MGYFDKFVDASFKKREDGKLVYYPYAYFGPKYILSNESERRIRNFLKIYYIFALAIPIFLVVINRIFLGIMSLLLIFAFYLIAVTVMLSHSEKIE